MPLLQGASLPYGFLVFPFLGRSFSGFLAFVLAMFSYWIYMAGSLGIILWRDRELAHRLRSLFESSHSKSWSALAFAPVLGVFIISFLPTASLLKAPILFAAVLLAVFNGALEEIFWRGVLLASLHNKTSIATRIGVGLGCFTAFHFAFLHLGVEYQGGAPHLVGQLFLAVFGW